MSYKRISCNQINYYLQIFVTMSKQVCFQGPKPEQTPAKPETPAADVKPGTPPGSSTASVSTDKNRNYAVLAGTVAVVCGLGWYLLSKPKKSEEAIDWGLSVNQMVNWPIYSFHVYLLCTALLSIQKH